MSHETNGVTHGGGGGQTASAGGLVTRKTKHVKVRTFSLTLCKVEGLEMEFKPMANDVINHICMGKLS